MCAALACTVQGQISFPVQLSNPHKLVLSPHVYGHGHHPYTRAWNFPWGNMPSIWEKHWARVPGAFLMGEWGGVWTATLRNGRWIPATAAWQQVLVDFLVERGIGYFYWTLNDNSFKTGVSPPRSTLVASQRTRIEAHSPPPRPCSPEGLVLAQRPCVHALYSSSA